MLSVTVISPRGVELCDRLNTDVIQATYYTPVVPRNAATARAIGVPRLRLLRAVYHHYAAAKVATAPKASPATVDRIAHIYSAGQRRDVTAQAHAA